MTTDENYEREGRGVVPATPTAVEETNRGHGMTETSRSNHQRNAPSTRTMGDVSHTNPYTGESAGYAFRRGPTIAADGGRDVDRQTEKNDRHESKSDTKSVKDAPHSRTMKDVSHTPPSGSTETNRVFERGGRESESTVDSDRVRNRLKSIASNETGADSDTTDQPDDGAES